MPQMFPLNWIALYIYFTFLFIFMIINTFYYSKKMINNKNNFKPNYSNYLLNWKW